MLEYWSPFQGGSEADLHDQVRKFAAPGSDVAQRIRRRVGGCHGRRVRVCRSQSLHTLRKEKEPPKVLGPRAGYSPMIGMFVSERTWQREQNGVLGATEKLSQADLDYLYRQVCQFDWRLDAAPCGSREVLLHEHLGRHEVGLVVRCDPEAVGRRTRSRQRRARADQGPRSPVITWRSCARCARHRSPSSRSATISGFSPP